MVDQAKIIVERQGAIAIVTLNDPAARNPLTNELINQLCDFLRGANDDDTLSCIVLTGAGKSFCAGGNIKHMRDGGDPMYSGTPHQMQEAYRAGVQQIPRLMNALDVPIIAAVNGHAIGAGCDLASMCDIRVASETATFAESFMRVGIVSGDGGAWLLPRAIGVSKALEMALTCRVLDAAEALSWGLVTHVVPPEELMEQALELAKAIASFPPRSIRLNKRLIVKSQEMTLDGSLELSAAFQAIAQNTADQKEAVNALLEKREPVYSGE
jgi:enoyl-CoA hydratase/carnithine racemase|tara:strand:+ start:24810 stop:25616 length:807 start_codon:yes stop_codon:yes gene_type:complete